MEKFLNGNVRLCYINEGILISGYIEGNYVQRLDYWNGGIDSCITDKKEVNVLVTEYKNRYITRHILDKKTNEILKIEIEQF